MGGKLGGSQRISGWGLGIRSEVIGCLEFFR